MFIVFFQDGQVIRLKGNSSYKRMANQYNFCRSPKHCREEVEEIEGCGPTEVEPNMWVEWWWWLGRWSRKFGVFCSH
jgi:hypothetical protein